jgi:hypothetical protein
LKHNLEWSLQLVVFSLLGVLLDLLLDLLLLGVLLDLLLDLLLLGVLLVGLQSSFLAQLH